jgi:peroxiredoxin
MEEDMKKRALIAVMLVCVMLVSSGCWMAGYSNKGSSEVKSGSKFLSDFSGETMTGKSVDKSVFKGHKLTMLYFWGTYDSSGIRQLSTLEDISADYANDGVQVIGVLVNVREKNDGVIAKKKKRAKSSIKDKKVTFDNIIPSKEMLVKMQTAVEVVPLSIFVDSSGNQVGKDQAGVKEKADWDKIITSYLSKVS